MATQSYATGGGNWPRRLTLGSENFTKEGKPIFREWLREGPPPEGVDTTGRRFIAHNGHYYELFAVIGGRFVGMEVIAKELEGKTKHILYVMLDDDLEKLIVELGRVDGRYALNFLQRLCDPALIVSQPIFLEAYRFTPKDAARGTFGPKEKFGINVRQGVDTALKPPKNLPGYSQPEATEYPIPGGRILDFMPIARYNFKYVQDNILSKLPKIDAFAAIPKIEAQPAPANGIQTDIRASEDASRFPQAPPVTQTEEQALPGDYDDLPF